jgi:hypothetical protein
VSVLALPATLYKAPYAISNVPKRFRCYIWHVVGPNVDSEINVGLILGASAPVTISNLKWESDTTANLTGMGICTASAQLYDSYDSTSNTLTVLNDVVVAQAASSIPANQAFGCVLEFDAVTSFPLGATLQVRTVAYSGDLLTVPNSFSSPPVRPSAHPRGNWPHANALFYGGALDVAPGVGPSMVQLRCCDKDKAEEQTYNSLFNPNGTTNKGLYGVNLTYRFLVSNSGDGPHNVWAYLMALNTGGEYFGASKIVSPGPNPDRKVPAILHDKANPLIDNIVELTTLPAHVVPPESAIEIDIAVANGGSSTMPYMLILSRIDLRTHP